MLAFVVASLSTGNKIGLAAVGAAFIVFALVSSFVLPRRMPNFPGRFMGLYLTIAVLFFIAMLAARATHNLQSRTAMLSGLVILLPSLALLVAAQALQSLLILLCGTAVSGIAAALGYRGSLQVVNQIAPAEKRAAVVSSYFVCCFIGNALPVIGVGVLSSFTRSIVADVAFACVISAFALVALIFGLAQRR